VRVGVYVDAFNVYYGGRDHCGRGAPGWRWLDLASLSASLIDQGLWPSAKLARVVYCTAPRDRAGRSNLDHRPADLHHGTTTQRGSDDRCGRAVRATPEVRRRRRSPRSAHRLPRAVSDTCVAARKGDHRARWHPRTPRRAHDVRGEGLGRQCRQPLAHRRSRPAGRGGHRVLQRQRPALSLGAGATTSAGWHCQSRQEAHRCCAARQLYIWCGSPLVAPARSNRLHQASTPSHCGHRSPLPDGDQRCTHAVRGCGVLRARKTPTYHHCIPPGSLGNEGPGLSFPDIVITVPAWVLLRLASGRPG
jgi:hypothetical protein